MQYIVQKDQSQSLTQNLNISKNLIVSLKILSMTSEDLFRHVDSIVLSNPGIVFENRNHFFISFCENDSVAHDHTNSLEVFFENLHEQINHLNCDNTKKLFLHHVIEQFLDKNLYLNLKGFCKKYSSIKYHIWLNDLKRLKPAGIGARSLQERFKHQLESKGLKQTISYKIVDECWKLFIYQDYGKICALLRVRDCDIQNAIEVILKTCRSRLLIDSQSNRAQPHVSIPDLILRPDQSVSLNPESVPRIKFDSYFLDAWKKVADRDAQGYFERTHRQVDNLTNLIKKRNETLLSVAKVIFALHKEYRVFENKKRLTLNDIASRMHLSQSTVSRALRHKTILTPSGVKMMVDFLKPLTYHFS